MGTGLLQPTHVIFLGLLEFGFGYLLLAVPAFIVCQRRNVELAGLAFIPFVGPWIAILRSARLSPWLTILALIPLVNIVFALYAAFTIPGRHGRTAAWGIWFIVPLVDIIGFWVYA